MLHANFQQEYLEFERVQQTKLEEDIAKIRALIAEAEGPTDSSESALEGWIQSLKVCTLEKVPASVTPPVPPTANWLVSEGLSWVVSGAFGAVWPKEAGR
jgi:hypothetical protein